MQAASPATALTAGTGPGDQKKMESIASKQNCTQGSCANTSAVILAEQRLCLEHYFAWCYQRLEALEVQVRRKSPDPAQDTTLRAMVEECSNRTLAVSLQHEPLTNQDRSRLLDILLWTSDLLDFLRAPHTQLPDGATLISRHARPALVPPTHRRTTR